MKEYTYYGDLEKDIKKLKQKFNLTKFSKYFITRIISLIITAGILYLIGLSIYIGTFIGMLIGFSAVDIIKVIKETKEDSQCYMDKAANLYENINLNYSDRALSMIRMKECISLQRKEKIIEDINTENMVFTNEEKEVTYFYLLDPDKKIQILRQIKEEIINNKDIVYLLEEEDIKRENIRIPNDKILKLRKKN